MCKLKPLILTGVALVAIPISLASMTERLDLDSLRWKNRVVVVFAASSQDHDLKMQDLLLAQDRLGLDERDIKVLHVIGPEAVTGKERSQLEIGTGSFAFVLIGKDGTVKLRRHRPVSVQDLFRLLDSMPMRKREMSRSPQSS